MKFEKIFDGIFCHLMRPYAIHMVEEDGGKEREKIQKVNVKKGQMPSNFKSSRNPNYWIAS